jgi:hypothetical protein
VVLAVFFSLLGGVEALGEADGAGFASGAGAAGDGDAAGAGASFPVAGVWASATLAGRDRAVINAMDESFI